jgi:DNA repair protein RecO (recombination protein O)
MMPSFDGDAILLSARTWGEGGVLCVLFAKEQGLIRGLMKRKPDGLIGGDTVRFSHMRRLPTQLGTLKMELAVSRAAWVMNDPAAALLVGYLTEVLPAALPEEHPYPELYGALESLWHGDGPWWRKLAMFERALLAASGYGLSLHDDAVPCAEGSQLTYVSPTSGRAVSAAMGEPYADRLLMLPALWGGPPSDEPTECSRALRLTGAFLSRVCQAKLHGKELVARGRLAEHVGMSTRSARNETVLEFADSLRAVGE